MRAEQILDALVGAKSKPADGRMEERRPPGFLEEALSAFGFGEARAGDAARGPLRQGFGDARSTLGDWISGARGAMGRNPTLTAGALAAAAGMLLTGRGRGLLGSIAGIGGLGLIGALAYNAYRKYQDRKADAPNLDRDALSPEHATEDDTRLFARVMVAAIAADGRIDAIERARIARGLKDAGLDADGAAWLEREFAAPASADEIAREATTPEKAAQIYSAARLAIEPDTPEERAFLEKLAAALRLDPALRSEIDGGATDLKAGA